MNEFVAPVGLPSLAVIGGERLLPAGYDRRAFGVQSLLPHSLNRRAFGVNRPGEADELYRLVFSD